MIDSSTLLCVHSTSQISVIIHHFISTPNFCAREHYSLESPRPSGIPLVGPHRASLGASLFVSACHPPNFSAFCIIQYQFFHLSFYSAKHSLCGTVLKIQLYCLWRQQQYFPLHLVCTDVHLATEENSYQLGDKGKASPDKIPSKVPLTTGSCHLPSTLTKPILPVLHEKLHAAAARPKWEGFCTSASPESQNPNPQSITELSLLSIK